MVLPLGPRVDPAELCVGDRFTTQFGWLEGLMWVVVSQDPKYERFTYQSQDGKRYTCSYKSVQSLYRVQHNYYPDDPNGV